jgi:hypothetical protein
MLYSNLSEMIVFLKHTTAWLLTASMLWSVGGSISSGICTRQKDANKCCAGASAGIQSRQTQMPGLSVSAATSCCCPSMSAVPQPPFDRITPAKTMSDELSIVALLALCDAVVLYAQRNSTFPSYSPSDHFVLSNHDRISVLQQYLI